ncbi:MAG: hypothetical protein RIQ56_656, partial [Candidatus Parcubacteria bacterium]
MSDLPPRIRDYLARRRRLKVGVASALGAVVVMVGVGTVSSTMHFSPLTFVASLGARDLGGIAASNSPSRVAPKSQPTTQVATQGSQTSGNSTGENSVSSPIVRTQNSIIERVIETIQTVSGVTFADLQSLEERLTSRINNIKIPPATVPQQVAAGGSGYVLTPPPISQRIDQLNNVTITNPTIVGGSVSGTAGVSSGIGDHATTTSFYAAVGHFASGVIDALSSAAATLTNLTATELVATNATTTNLKTNSLTLGSGTGVLYSTSGVVAPISNGLDGRVLKLSGGVPTWAVDNTGSGGGASAWATTTDNLAVYPSDTSQTILIGTNATSTTGNILEVRGNTLLRGNQTVQGSITTSAVTATSSFTVNGTTQLGAGTSTNFAISTISSGSLLKTTTGGAIIAATGGVDYALASAVF